MIAKMNTRERILAALAGREVDYVPMCTQWNTRRLHEKLTWKTERERLEMHLSKGWDTYIRCYVPITPLKDVKVEKKIVTEGDIQVMYQTWKTPAGEVTEKLKVTDDWDELDDNPDYMRFMSDFRTSRYLEFPFKEEKDLETLEYLFPIVNPADEERLKQDYYDKRKLANELGFPIFTYMDSGMDWLLWLYPAEEAVYRVIDRPDYVKKLLAHINKAKCRRLEVLLDLGVDGVKRRGWYESADFWSPEIFRTFAKPQLEAEADIVHNAGKPYAYIMVTGVMPLLPELASLNIDCLVGPDPVLEGQNLRKIREALHGKTIWGGFSGTEHFLSGTPEDAEKAVEDAFSICGKSRFILGMEVSFRYYFKWDNFEAAVRAWKRLR